MAGLQPAQRSDQVIVGADGGIGRRRRQPSQLQPVEEPALDLAMARVGDRGVDPDAMEPHPGRLLWSPAVSRPVSLDERLLRDVLGRRAIQHDAADGPVERVVVLLIEAIEVVDDVVGRRAGLYGRSRRRIRYQMLKVLRNLQGPSSVSLRSRPPITTGIRSQFTALSSGRFREAPLTRVGEGL